MPKMLAVLLQHNVSMMHVKRRGVKANPVVIISSFLPKSSKRAARINVPTRRTNLYRQSASQHMNCGWIRDLILMILEQILAIQSSIISNPWKKCHISTLPGIESVTAALGPMTPSLRLSGGLSANYSIWVSSDMIKLYKISYRKGN